MKKCSKCSESKPETEFYKKKGCKNGLSAQCKKCTIKEVSVWGKNNRDKTRVYVSRCKAKDPEKIKEQSHLYYIKNKEAILKRNKKWSDSNPKTVLKLRQEWTKENPHYYTMTGRIRRHHINKRCTPPWVDEVHLEKIKEIYKSAKARSAFHEVPFHVDHISPLKGVNEKGEYVSSGLHVWWNLQVITAEENLKKSNKLKTTK